jgi:DNA repair exonuclease SbcCD ATPase subunit
MAGDFEVKLLQCRLENFCSYASLEFDFSDLGLALIYGATGSGKSTLQDAPVWIILGSTAKGGSVDSVRSWQTPDLPTKGILEVELQNGTITITRIRGKANQNDLYWTEKGQEEKHRGKDLTDTQKLICGMLGITEGSYIASSYFHEFSLSSGFFTTKAKDRRELFEGIADLGLPSTLFQAAAEHRKTEKVALTHVQSNLDKKTGCLEQLRRTWERARADCAAWDNQKTEIIKDLTLRGTRFEADKAERTKAANWKASLWEQEQAKKISRLESRLEELCEAADGADKDIENINKQLENLKDGKCKECGLPSKFPEISKLTVKREVILGQKTEFRHISAQVRELYTASNPMLFEVELAKAMINDFSAQVEREIRRLNPHESMVYLAKTQILETEYQIVGLVKALECIKRRLSGLERLQEISAVLRGELVRKAVYQTQEKTNEYLSTHFDSEFKVELLLAGSDTINVSIDKNGYSCDYKSLSKGQRQLLRLCFSTAIMQATANNTGVHPQTLFYDEALDGLDTELKIKAFGLFQELQKSHSTVMVIDHSPELRQLFNTRYRVTLSGDNSIVEYEDESSHY